MCTLAQYGAILLALLATASALEILSPTPGSGVDPTKPLSILWSVDYNDPALIDIKFTNANPNDVTTDLTLATGVASYTGGYTVPENTIQNFGTGYQILILSGGTTIASSTGLVLGQSSNEVTTDANGQATLVSTASMTASGQQHGSSVLTSSVPTASIESVGTTIVSGTEIESIAETTTAATTSRVSSFVTSTSSRSSSSSQSSASATSAQSTNTANGQGRLGGEFVLGAAGVLAGLVALLA